MLHSVRHSYAELCVEAGLESLALQLALGHSKPTTTSRYTAGAKVAPVVDVTFIDLEGKNENRGNSHQGDGGNFEKIRFVKEA